MHRLPAVSLKDIEPPALAANGSCRATWDTSVPVRCGVDKTRYLVEKLGARGQADTESWPARGANNSTLTTAVVELYSISVAQDQKLKLRCSPRWLRRDGSPPQSAALTPVVTELVMTQSAGPVFAGEGSQTWSSVTSTEDSVFFDGSFSKNTPTGSDRYLPRVISCAITAEDPANNGLPVYATGVYVAIANASAPYGIELRPNFVFPLV